MAKAPTKSSADDGSRSRNNEFFESLYFQLIERYRSLFSVSRLNGISIKELFIVDSTTIRLYSDILKGVGRNPAGDGLKKGGSKVNMLSDAEQSLGKFMRITKAKHTTRTSLKTFTYPGTVR